jgi:hypothetical protein
MSRKRVRKRRSVETPTIGHDDDAFYIKYTNNATTDTFFLAGNRFKNPAEDS